MQTIWSQLWGPAERAYQDTSILQETLTQEEREAWRKYFGKIEQNGAI